MGQVKIMPYNYNTLCDTYKCNNLAAVSIGVPGEPANIYHNICNECLQDIINHAPIDMVLNRKDIQSMINSDNTAVEGSVQKDIDLNSLGIRDLRAMAKDKGLTGYSNLNKSDLIKLLEDEK